MRRTSFADERCSIARALDLIGEWWTLLIVREAVDQLSAPALPTAPVLGLAINFVAAIVNAVSGAFGFAMSLLPFVMLRRGITASFEPLRDHV